MVLGISKEKAIETAKTAAQSVLLVGGIVAHSHPNPIVSALGSIAASGTAKWNAANVASGVYFYRMEAKPLDGGQGFQQVKKLMVVK